jgi:hypothetical protein
MLEDRRWRRLERSFHEWLSVQSIYTPAEIEALKTRLKERIQGMSIPELEDFMDDAEDRLGLLLSDEAIEARSWLTYLTPEARRRMVSSQGQVPDVFGMSVSQLRQELNQFLRQRAERSAAQASINRTRDQQVAQAAQDRRAQQEAAPRRQAATYGTNQPVAPQRPREIPRYPGPHFWITPWGGVARDFR